MAGKMKPKAKPKPPMKGGAVPPKVFPGLAPKPTPGKMASGRGTVGGK